MKAHAIVFDAPRQLSVKQLDLREPGAEDLVVDVAYSGISTGTERLLWTGTMPAFPGLSYPLVPGYETVGVVKHAPPTSPVKEGQWVFVPGSYTFTGAQNLFGGAGATMVVPHSRVIPVDESLGANAILLALAATSYHAVSIGGKRDPIIAPDLIVGHGIMGRLLARLVVAAGLPAPTVWETNAVRQAGGEGYKVIHPDEDTRKDYQAIYDVSGDSTLLNGLISRLAHGGEVVLAGFYDAPLSFVFPPAFMREARIRIAAQWSPPDLAAVIALAGEGRLSLDGLITHHHYATQADAAYRTAFGDADCLKMVLDWKHTV